MIRRLFDYIPRPWSIDRVKAPWGSGQPLLDFVATNPGSDTLPDESSDDSTVRWAPGALDALFVPTEEDAKGAADRVGGKLQEVLRRSSDSNANDLYAAARSESTAGYVDVLLASFTNSAPTQLDRLHRVGHWLATRSPHREPVKLGLSLMGIAHTHQTHDVALKLARHDEFTLFAVMALLNSGRGTADDLLSIAQSVKGWGRIQAIYRIEGRSNDQLRTWLLREGYRNEIMVEYTALICAREGDLLNALRLPAPDEALLAGAGDIIGALIQGRGGPVEGIESYADGPLATVYYLRLAAERELSVNDFLNVAAIRSFLMEEGGEAYDPELGWLQVREGALDFCASILAPDRWVQRVAYQLEHGTLEECRIAHLAARHLDLDDWRILYSRLQGGDSLWYEFLQGIDEPRLNNVLSLAQELLPLEAMASGPAEAMGFGPEFENHTALDFLLQTLRDFPGRGWPLIRVGLKSPVIRNRNMAAQALACWDRYQWEADTLQVLGEAIRNEPVQETRERLEALVAGHQDLGLEGS